MNAASSGTASGTTTLFHATVAALCESLVTGLAFNADAASADCQPTVDFVLRQCNRMPDYLRLPLRILTLLFALQTMIVTGTRFHRLSPLGRQQRLAAWRQSRLGFRRDFIRFYESLSVLGWYALQKNP